MSGRVEFRFVQKEPSTDGSFDECYTFVFFITFNDIRTYKPCRLKYVGRAERIGEVIAIKFYASRDRKSRYDKYSLAHRQMGAGAVLSIFHRCLEIIRFMLEKFPDSSFIIKASEAFDPGSQRLEPEANNQRFRIYRSYLAKMIGIQTFEHFQYPQKSIYVLVRRGGEDPEVKLERIMGYLNNRFNLNWL